MAELTAHNVDLSNHVEGSSFSVNCIVDTCISDMVVQIFKDDQLLESSTVGINGTKSVTTVGLKALQGAIGTYTCRAMTDMKNEVFRKRFSVTGMMLRSNQTLYNSQAEEY